MTLKKKFSLHKVALNASTDRGNELEKFISLKNRQEDYENCQFNIEEATEGLFRFDHSDEHQEVSMGSVEKDTRANKKKASKRDVIVMEEDLLARNSDRTPKNTKKVNFWGLNVWNEWAAERNALPKNTGDLFSQVPSAEVLHTVCDFELCFWIVKFVYYCNIHLGDCQL